MHSYQHTCRPTRKKDVKQSLNAVLVQVKFKRLNDFESLYMSVILVK